MRTDNIKVTITIPIPYNKPDKNGNIYTEEAVEKAMEGLKVRELRILKDRFLIGKTQMEIAEELGISQAQISRIEKSAISNIKKLIK